MERLRRVTPKRLMMAVVLLVLLLILLNSLSWQWWQEKKHYEQCYVKARPTVRPYGHNGHGNGCRKRSHTMR